MTEEHLDHEAALDLARLKHASNLARCYLDLYQRHVDLQVQHQELKGEMESIRSMLTTKADAAHG